ncbi:hypothetical protein Tco_0640696 [Tanacetum coccineum]
MSSGLSASMAEVAAMFESALRTSELVRIVRKDDEFEDEEIEESMDSDSVSEDAEDEGPTAEDGNPAVEDEGLTGGQGPRERRRLYLGVSSRHFGSWGTSESERPERVSVFRQPTLTTWTDPKDGMIYIDIPDYQPPVPPVQTPPLPEWTSGSLPISPSHYDVPLPISLPMIPLTVPSPVATPATVETEGFLTKLGAQVKMQGGLIRDHAVRLEELSSALFERSLEYEQERVIVKFEAIWRPVLALEAWACQTYA